MDRLIERERSFLQCQLVGFCRGFAKDILGCFTPNRKKAILFIHTGIPFPSVSSSFCNRETKYVFVLRS